MMHDVEGFENNNCRERYASEANYFGVQWSLRNGGWRVCCMVGERELIEDVLSSDGLFSRCVSGVT